jgi:acyl carrier protein
LVGRLAALPAARWEPTLMETVRTEAAAVLGYASSDDIDAELPFRDLGFDSLAGVELKNRLVALTGLDLPATLVFDHPTPAELAGHLTGRLRGDTQPTLPDSLEELRRLEVALESAAGDEELRREVTGRLRRLLDRWSVPAQAAAEAELPDLDQASDDEVFDLLDRELGTT